MTNIFTLIHAIQTLDEYETTSPAHLDFIRTKIKEYEIKPFIFLNKINEKSQAIAKITLSTINEY